MVLWRAWAYGGMLLKRAMKRTRFEGRYIVMIREQRLTGGNVVMSGSTIDMERDKVTEGKLTRKVGIQELS